MDRQAVAGWLDRYIAVWKSYDRQAIGDLFTEDAEYAYNPWNESVRGREAVVAYWFQSPDDPGTYDAHYELVAVDGDTAVATGRSLYYKKGGAAIEHEYYNVFIMRFDANGRCASFTEWYMEKPQAQD